MEDLSRILHDLDQGSINVTDAKKLILDLFSVSGMFSEEKLKEAYEDGWNDYCVDCFMEFNADNYR